MTIDRIYNLAGTLVLSQLLAVAWAVNRQIKAPEDRKENVIGLPDVLNIFSLFVTIDFVILMPLVSGSHLRLSATVLCFSYTLIGFYPLTVAAHYRLWRRSAGWGTSVPAGAPLYANREEVWITLVASVLAVIAAAWTRL